MTHRWHDLYHHQKTPAHHLDPRTKFLGGIVFVGVIVSRSEISRAQGVSYGLFLGLCLLGAQLSWRAFVTRLMVILPIFVSLGLSWIGGLLPLHRIWMLSVKSLLSVGAMAVVSLSTPFPDLLRALEALHVPRVLTLILAFVYRYMAVLIEEVEKIEKAWASRYVGGQIIRQWTLLGHIVATFLIRSFERAERVYAAMQSRGFSGQAPLKDVLHFSVWDVVFGILLGFTLGILQWNV